jgi:hypothetical protein
VGRPGGCGARSAAGRRSSQAGRVFRSRVSYLAGVISLGTVLFAELRYLAERGRHSTLPTFGSALAWAGASVIGQSPTVTPATAGGQVVMLACLALGVVAVSTLSGAVGAYLLHPTGPDGGAAAGG